MAITSWWGCQIKPHTGKITPVGPLDRATLHSVCKNDDWCCYTAVCNVPKHLVSPTAYTDAARGLLVTSASSPKYCPLEQRATSTSVLSCWAAFVCNRHRQTYSMSHTDNYTWLNTQLNPLICGLWQLHVVAETDIIMWVGTEKIGLAYIALKTILKQQW